MGRTMKMIHKIYHSENGEVHYWINSNSKKKETIFFTHGLTADHTMYDKQVEFFSNEFNIITWDLPLHGLSKNYKNFSYHQTSLDMKGILNNEGITEIYLVGMSLGGYPCQHFAAMYTSCVKGFVAIDTTPLGLDYYSKSDIFWLKRVSPIASLFSKDLLCKSMARSISYTDYSYRVMMNIYDKNSKDDILRQIDIAYGKFIEENVNVEFSFPVLILLGEKDNTGKVKKYCREWSKSCGYPIHIIKKAKHFSNCDNSEQVNNEIMNFITVNERI